MKKSLGQIVVVAGMILLPTGLLAQGVGVVTGQVTDRATSQSLAGVQVFIPATTLRTITDAEPMPTDATPSPTSRQAR